MTSEESKAHDRLVDIFEKHTEQDDKRFESIETKLDIIKDNHLAHVQADMEKQSIDIAKQTTNVEWLMKFFWVIATASIGGLVASLFNLLR